MAAKDGVRRGDGPPLDPSSLKGAVPSPQVPQFVEPELATLVSNAPQGAEWLHEIKYDGYRALARVEHGSVSMYSRNRKDWTGRFDVLVAELARLPVESAVIDGEVAVLLPDGTTSFQELQNLLGAPRTETAKRGKTGGRLVYYVFDLLYLNGYDLLGVAVEERKHLLGDLVGSGRNARLLFSDHIPGHGPELLARACGLGLEGIVSKRAGSPYRPGTRGSEWIKTKCLNEQEFVVGGYTDPGGGRSGFGALLLGVSGDKGLRYVGKVGTGFNEQTLDHLGAQLRSMRVDAPPFTENFDKAPRHAHWVRPELVAQVAFAEWTAGGGLRHPSFKGLRADKPANEVSKEVATEAIREASAPAERAPVAERAPAAMEGAGTVVNGVTITHPDRVFWPVTHTSKSELIAYYDTVAERMLPYVLNRPVSMVRCPAGVGGGEGSEGARSAAKPRGGQMAGCFFNKHPSEDFPGPVGRVTITESGGPAAYLTITEPASLTALAQMGVLEVHIWGATWPDIEHPDLLVLDLDPGPGVAWRELADGARLVRRVLRSAGLESFVKTTGGKGLHVVVPLVPSADWGEVRLFCRRVADTVVEIEPERFTANMAKAKREGRIFVDYVRNNRGSTSIAPFSTRAKDRPTVAVPLRWEELGGRIRPDSYTIQNVSRRLEHLRSDPWEGYAETARGQTLSTETREALLKG